MVIAVDILIIAALGLAMIFITPHLSGWNKIGSVYRAPGAPSGERFPLEWAKIGDIYFWGITVYRSPDGIYFPVSPIFGFGQRPLFIPWSELRNPREKQLFFTRMQEFDVGLPSVGTIQLRSDIVKNRVQHV